MSSSAEGANSQPTNRIHAHPTKDFFVTMITRDISLQGCIFDLLDNSIDGARRHPSEFSEAPFKGYEIQITFDSDHFSIADNCGGILLSDAIDYAFHFGRRRDSPNEVEGGIGLYGIGMKRAIFKIGRSCTVESDAQDAAFKVSVEVDEWERKEDWDFEYEGAERKAAKGTKIDIRSLNDGIKQALGDSAFKNVLMREIARDYSFFIQQGLKILVKEEDVPSYRYQLVQTERMAPAVEEYEDDGVKIRILAGLVDELMDEIPEELRPDKVDRYGWFVVCNDRVVLAADKGARTVWGDDNFNVWHPQYNGFAGFVFFQASDQRKLPWTTTKRDLDGSSPLYRRAIANMKRLTQEFIDYTNRRKFDLGTAKAGEASRSQVDVSTLKSSRPFNFPEINGGVSRPDTVTISYKKTKREIEEIKEHLGNISLSARDVGIRTFEYYREMELGK